MVDIEFDYPAVAPVQLVREAMAVIKEFTADLEDSDVHADALALEVAIENEITGAENVALLMKVWFAS